MCLSILIDEEVVTVLSHNNSSPNKIEMGTIGITALYYGCSSSGGLGFFAISYVHVSLRRDASLSKYRKLIFISF